MKKEDIKQLATSDLIEKIKIEKENLDKLIFNHSVSPIENPLRIRAARKTVAKLKTELTERKNKETK